MAQGVPPGEAPAGATVLDVPYFPQSELLCGGAAAAMVLRYWGMAGVRPEDFAHLVSEARGGMTAQELAAEVAGLGWEAFPFRGRVAEVRRHLRLGRPVVSLIEVAGGRFHYVVLVGLAGERVVMHDPAAAPFRLVDAAELDAAWEATGGLSLLILPPSSFTANARPPAGGAAGDVSPLPPAPCRPPYDRGLAAAAAGRLREAEALLDRGPCRDEPAFLRERAGVLLRLGRAGEAAGLARRALAAEPRDAHAARTLATALYVAGRAGPALNAWNRVGEPTVDLVRIAGLERVAHIPVAAALGIRGGDLLTARSLRLARRRLADLPAAAVSRVEYAPTGGGRADVVAAIAERPGLSPRPVPLAALALRAAVRRELALTAVSPFGRGETWTGAWRWWENRPALSFEFAAPAALGLPALWRLGAGWERETYGFTTGTSATQAAPPAGDVPAREERTSAVVESSAWLLPELRLGARLGFDRWETFGEHGRLGLVAEARTLADRLSVTADVDAWASFEGDPAFLRGGLRAQLASRTRPEGLVATGRLYVRSTGRRAPRTLWPGAGAGIARPDLLRAHPLLEDGVITGRTFDRHLAGAGAEVVRWFAPHPALRLGAAVFVDAARAWGARPAGTETTFVDGGFGLRISTTAGRPSLRLDVATGLVDDEWAVTAGWSSGD